MSSWRWNPIVCWQKRNRSAAASRDHRSGRRAQQHDRRRSGTTAVRGIGDTLRIAGGGSGGRSGRLHDILKSLRIRSRSINYPRLPDLFTPGLTLSGTVRCSGAASGRYHHPDGCFDHRLRGVSSPGEALVSTLGVTGGSKSSLYEDGVRRSARTA